MRSKSRLLSLLLTLPVAALSAVHRAVLFWVPAVAITATARTAFAKLYMTQEDALANAFPGARVDRRTKFLSDAEATRVEKAAQTRLHSRIHTYYLATKDGKPVGTAFFDTRIVRTLPMTFMVVMAPEGEVDSVEVLAFHEPEEYLPRFSWFNLFRGKSAEDRLRLKFDLPNVTGATLTCHAVTDGIRQALALHQVLSAEESK